MPLKMAENECGETSSASLAGRFTLLTFLDILAEGAGSTLRPLRGESEAGRSTMATSMICSAFVGLLLSDFSSFAGCLAGKDSGKKMYILERKNLKTDEEK